MLNKWVLLDMGAWIQTSASIDQLPYALQTFPVVVVALELDQWLLQAGSAAFYASTTDWSRSWVPTFWLMVITWSYPPSIRPCRTWQVCPTRISASVSWKWTSWQWAYRGWSSSIPWWWCPSKLKSTLAAANITWRILTSGPWRPHTSPEPALSALKEQQGFGRSILHWAGGTLAVLSQRSDLTEYALTGRTPRDPGN